MSFFAWWGNVLDLQQNDDNKALGLEAHAWYW